MDDKFSLADAMEVEDMAGRDPDDMTNEELYELGFRTGRRERNGNRSSLLHDADWLDDVASDLWKLSFGGALVRMRAIAARIREHVKELGNG